jgi:hypothetical protein
MGLGGIWPVITAEQWIALGTMLGGIAQFGLLVLAVYSARQWVHQLRITGLRALVDEYMLVMHGIDVAVGRARSLFRSKEDATSAYAVIAEKCVVLMGLATRCAYYNAQLADAIQQTLRHVQELLRAYEEVNMLEQTFRQDRHTLSDEEKVQLHERRQVLRFLLTHTEKDAWYDTYLMLQQSVMHYAIRVTWRVSD